MTAAHAEPIPTAANEAAPLRIETTIGKPVVALRFPDESQPCAQNAAVMIVSPAYHGIVTVADAAVRTRCKPTKEITYTPDPDYTGYDEFNFRVDVGAKRVTRTMQVGVLKNVGDVPPPPTQHVAPSLPDGDLLGVTASLRRVTFIDLERSSVTNGVARIRIYEIIAPPFQATHGLNNVQEVGDRVIDCAHHTSIEHRTFGFDESGREVIWYSGNSVEPIRPNSTDDFLARSMCGDLKLPPQNHVHGHAAAVALSQVIFRQGPPAGAR